MADVWQQSVECSSDGDLWWRHALLPENFFFVRPAYLSGLKMRIRLIRVVG